MESRCRCPSPPLGVNTEAIARLDRLGVSLDYRPGFLDAPERVRFMCRLLDEIPFEHGDAGGPEGAWSRFDLVLALTPALAELWARVAFFSPATGPIDRVVVRYICDARDRLDARDLFASARPGGSEAFTVSFGGQRDLIVRAQAWPAAGGFARSAGRPRSARLAIAPGALLGVRSLARPLAAYEVAARAGSRLPLIRVTFRTICAADRAVLTSARSAQ